jgi:hypothetical protein
MSLHDFSDRVRLREPDHGDDTPIPAGLVGQTESRPHTCGATPPQPSSPFGRVSDTGPVAQIQTALASCAAF